MAGQVFSLFADNRTQPLFDFRVVDIIVIDPTFLAGVVGRIDKDAVFDTNRKSLLRRISAEKGLK